MAAETTLTSGRPARPTTVAESHAGSNGAQEPVRTDQAIDLRADVRRVGSLLGDTLVRQNGPELLDLVEQVRTLTKQAREADVAADRRQRTDAGAADPGRAADRRRDRPGPRVRHLLPAGQRRRAGAPGARPAHPAGGRRASGRAWSPRSPTTLGPEALAAAIEALAVQPVFTAHPDRGEPAVRAAQAARAVRHPRRADAGRVGRPGTARTASSPRSST